ncbi:hypothetical protein D3C85_804440 [compost metagenome]
MVLHSGAIVEQVPTGIHIGGVCVGDGLGGMLGLKKAPHRLVPITPGKAEPCLSQGRLSHPVDDRFSKHFLVTKNAVNRTQRPTTDREDQRRVVGVGGVFLGRPAAALAARFLLRGLRHGFEVGVVNQVGADAISAGDPGDRLAAGTALHLQRIDARGAGGNGATAAPHR